MMVTSVKPMGSTPEWLSMVSETSVRPSAGRLEVPAKMTSSILLERMVLLAWAPNTQATASTMLDLPDPLGPTTTVIPGSRSRVVVSAKDLKPLSVRDLRNTAGNADTAKRGDELVENPGDNWPQLGKSTFSTVPPTHSPVTPAITLLGRSRRASASSPRRDHR